MNNSNNYSNPHISNQEFDKAFRDMNSKIPHLNNNNLSISSSITSIPLSNLTLGSLPGHSYQK